MKKISKVFLILSFLIFSNQTLNSRAEYLFLQQLNSSCMIFPMINLKRLDYLITKYGDQILRGEGAEQYYDFAQIPWIEWQSRRECFGEGYKHERDWYEAFGRINNKFHGKPDTYPNLRRYLKNSIAQGPTYPHYYDENGGFRYSAQDGYAVHFLPYLLVDKNFIYGEMPKRSDFDETVRKAIREYADRPFLSVPLAREQKRTIVYNPALREYEEVVHLTRMVKKPLTVKPAFTSFTYPALADLGRGGLGFSHVAEIMTWNWAFETEEVRGGYAYIPYMEGLCKLLLLRLGLDENNNYIGQDHDLHPVVEDLRTIANSGANNPWNDVFLTREKFLQYQVAKIFKDDRELFKRAKVAMSFAAEMNILPWEARSEFLKGVRNGEFYRKDGGLYQIEQVKKFLPGDEQALAFYVCWMIRLLWYGSLNEKAFLGEKDVEEGDDDDDDDDEIPFQRFKEFARQQIEGQDYSFLSVWHQVVEKLKTVTNRRNFVSFDGHGWLVSFDQKIINAQIRDLENWTGPETVDVDLLRDLRCVGIESWKSDLLKSAFYKRPRNEARWERLHKRWKKIQLRLLLYQRIIENKPGLAKKLVGVLHLLDQAKRAIEAGNRKLTDEFLKQLETAEREAGDILDKAAARIQELYVPHLVPSRLFEEVILLPFSYSNSLAKFFYSAPATPWGKGRANILSPFYKKIIPFRPKLLG